MMKMLLAFLPFVALIVAQDDKEIVLGELAHLEVQALMLLDPGLTMDQCIKQCDEKFGDPLHEMHTDMLCKHACGCEINKNCEDHTHPPCPTHASGMTHHDGVVC